MVHKMENDKSESKMEVNRLFRDKKYRRLDHKKLARLIKYIIRNHEEINKSEISISYHAEHTISNATASKIFESHLTKKEIRNRLRELASGGGDFEKKLLEFIDGNNGKSLTISAKVMKHARRFRVSCKIKPWC